MAHITIPPISPRIVYAVGATPVAAFAFPFPFFDATTDIRVWVDAAESTYAATPVGSGQFAVTPTGAADDGYGGGTVTLGAAVTNATVTIERNLSIQRTEDFPYPSPTFNIRAVNRALDRIAAWAQDLKRDIGRTLRLSPTDPAASLEIPDAATRAGKVLWFDLAGAPSVGDLPTGVLPATFLQDGAGSVAIPFDIWSRTLALDPRSKGFAPGNTGAANLTALNAAIDQHPTRSPPATLAAPLACR